MLLDNRLDDRETKACTALAFDTIVAATEVRLEDAGDFLRDDSEAFIPHRDLDRTAGVTPLHPDAPARRRKLDRIVNQVHQHLAQQIAIDLHDREIHRDIELETHAALIQQRRQTARVSRTEQDRLELQRHAAEPRRINIRSTMRIKRAVS
jgi:hypothetical protein